MATWHVIQCHPALGQSHRKTRIVHISHIALEKYMNLLVLMNDAGKSLRIMKTFEILSGKLREVTICMYNSIPLSILRPPLSLHISFTS